MDVFFSTKTAAPRSTAERMILANLTLFSFDMFFL